MLKPKDFLYFYRILNWENKISGVRPIGYTFFGYLMAGKFEFLPIIFNTSAIFGALTFCYSLNDYFDWKIQKERNFLAAKIQEGKISEKQALIYCFFPLIFLLPIFLINPGISLLIYLIGFSLILFYSLPPIRFKQRKFWGFIVPPLGATAIFLQGYSALSFLNLDIILLAVIIFLFQSYLETFHVFEDSLVKEEIKKIAHPKAILDLLKRLPLASLIVSLGFALLNPFFFINSFFSLIRFSAVRRFKIENIRKVRRNIFSLHWSLYEFGIYGILGLLHLF